MYSLKENMIKRIEVGDIVVSWSSYLGYVKKRRRYVVLKGNKNITEYKYLLASLENYEIKAGANSLEEIENEYVYLCTSGKGVKENE